MNDVFDRVLLFGGSGQLGADIIRTWAGVPISAPRRVETDVKDALQLALTFERVNPTLVINATAFHNVERCETEPEAAFAVNAVAVERLAELCAQRDCVFVTVSTDYVFSGQGARPYREDDQTGPLNAYGISKLAGELLAQRRGRKTLVIRTSGLYGTGVSSSKGYTFANKILSSAREGEPVRVVTDVIFSPSYTAHVAAALRALLNREVYGLYHVTNQGYASWFDFAVELFRQAGLDHPVEPISSAEWKSTVRRPIFSALDIGRIAALGVPMPSWQDGITAYLHDRSQLAPT